MCSLVMSLCSHDLHVTLLNNHYYNTLNSSRLTVLQLARHLDFGWYNINLFTELSFILKFWCIYLIVMAVKFDRFVSVTEEYSCSQPSACTQEELQVLT